MKVIKTDFDFQIGEVVTDIIYDIKSKSLGINLAIGQMNSKIMLKESLINSINNQEIDLSYDTLYKTYNEQNDLADLKEQLDFNEARFDICIVELKTNGGLDFNNPGCDFEELSSNNHIGIKKIMESKALIVVACGPKMARAVKTLLESTKTNEFPASIVLDHENSYLIVDNLAGKSVI